MIQTWEAWRAVETSTPRSTVACYGSAARRLARHGIRAPQDATRAAVVRYQDERRREGRAPATVNNELSALLRLLRFAARADGAVAARLAELETLWLDLPPAPPPTFFTHDEFDRLRREALRIGQWLWTGLTVACFSGLRRGELVRLAREDVDVLERVIRVRRRPEPGGRGETKTRLERTVSMSPELVTEITGRLPAAGPVLGVGSDRAKRALRELARWTGISATWPKCRRTFTTWALRSGIPITDVARWLGHTDISMLHRHYYVWCAGYSPLIERFRPSST